MHVSLYVADLGKTLSFYEDLFGQKPTKQKPGYGKFELTDPALVISFVENPGKAAPAFGHMGLRVGSEATLKSHFERIKAAGSETLEEQQTRCCYALQDKFWVADPDGYRWEVYYFHEDSEWNDPEYSAQEGETCCDPALSSQEEKETCCTPRVGRLKEGACC